MSNSESISAAPVGLCLDCNYSLAGLASRQCPECGRAFDPGLPGTMNMGRPIRKFARHLLQPVGGFTVIAALLSTAAMVAVTRLPLGRPLDEARYYLRLAYWKTPDPARGWHEWTYLAGLLLTMWVAVTFVSRVLVQPILLRVHHRPRLRQRVIRQMTIVGLVVINAIAIAFGWPYRTGRLWVAHEMLAADAAAKQVLPWLGFEPIASPVPLPTSDAVQALMAAATTMPDPRARLTAVQLLYFHYPERAPTSLVRLIDRERTPEVCAAEIHLYTVLDRNGATPLLDRYLSDPRPQVRAAAADGIGINCALEPGRFQLYTEQNNWWSWFYVELNMQPPLRAKIPSGHLGTTAPPTLRQREVLEKMMRSGADSQEREAAARALLPWPPNGYSLRVAEWGVWVSNNGELKLIQSVLDEIPPFVHTTGNTIGELSDRVNMIMMVTKPIIHVISNVTMSADISVVMRAGRPWYAYPLPDDFSVSAQLFDRQGKAAPVSPLISLDNPVIPPLADVREGYPWLLPHHRSVGTTSSGPGANPQNELVGVGLRWQSLIVSPERLPWMQPPAVAKDPRFAWWEKLRAVPSCWVSSRGEADRFLYYDGPTLANAPVAAALNGPTLHLERPGAKDLSEQQPSPGEEAYYAAGSFIGLKQSSQHYDKRRGMFIEVTANHIRGFEAEVSDDAGEYSTTPSAYDLQGPAVEAHFRSMLRERGFSEAEGGGLISSWETQFFHKPGRRFLLLMSPRDYDLFCPIQVHPAPTALVRVGVVLTEF